MAARILIVFLGFALLVAFEWARGSVTGAGRAAKEGGAAALPPIQPSELIVEVAAATGQMPLLFPVFSVGIALLYLLFDAALEALVTKNHEFLNAPIYYSCLYMPFSAVYFILKRRLRGRAIAGLRLPT